MGATGIMKGGDDTLECFCMFSCGAESTLHFRKAITRQVYLAITPAPVNETLRDCVDNAVSELPPQREWALGRQRVSNQIPPVVEVGKSPQNQNISCTCCLRFQRQPAHHRVCAWTTAVWWKRSLHHRISPCCCFRAQLCCPGAHRTRRTL